MLRPQLRSGQEFDNFARTIDISAFLQIDPRTKTLIAIAVDVINQQDIDANLLAVYAQTVSSSGITKAEIEELLLFMCAYAGFNKVAKYFKAFKKIFEQIDMGKMISSIRKADYAVRDRQGKAVFYVLLRKKPGISYDMFRKYWRNVHGTVCARLPAQYQYWQFHLAHNQGNLFPPIDGIQYTTPLPDQFDGIAELTFVSESDRQQWLESASILMDDEHNIFDKAIGYNTNSGNSLTYVDGIKDGAPNGTLDLLKFHVLVKKSDSVSVAQFRTYLQNFAQTVAKSELVLKLRLHLFEEIDSSRADAAEVIHYEPAEKQYQAALEIAFADSRSREQFFASSEYARGTQDQAQYVKQLTAFPERATHTFVYGGEMTLAGQRSSRVAELITDIGATNQLKKDIVFLMNGKQQDRGIALANGKEAKSGLGHYLQGVQHFGITVDDMPRAIEFYTEVLGGKVAIGGDGFVGDVLHNTLFQKEDIDAIELGVNPRTLGVPNLRDGTEEALDVRFISFGNTVVELIHFRDAALSHKAPNVFGRIPSGVGRVNAPHLSFHVKDDVDLNLFANILEEECQKRGMTSVICNKVIQVNSQAERKKVAAKYNANKFWHDSEYFIEGYSDSEFGNFHGWSLFYCKGPNGEQLEFNQVTRTAQSEFKRAQQEYNQANGTNFPWASDTIQKSRATEPSSATPAQNSLNGSQANSTEFSGKLIDIVRQMFKAGESMNVENFVKFYTNDALYQFGNFPVAYGPQGIREASVDFLNKVEKVYHHMKNMWQVGNDTVVAEMEVTYIRHDGQVFTLPCCDTIKFKEDKVQELRIYMDINPVFS